MSTDQPWHWKLDYRQSNNISSALVTPRQVPEDWTRFELVAKAKQRSVQAVLASRARRMARERDVDRDAPQSSRASPPGESDAHKPYSITPAEPVPIPGPFRHPLDAHGDAWPANVLASRGVRAMLQHVATEHLPPAHQQPPAPYAKPPACSADSTALAAHARAAEVSPSVLIAVELKYHPAARGHARAGGGGLSGGVSLAHDPQMYEGALERLRDLIGEEIAPPAASDRAASGGSPPPIPARVVRAPPVAEESYRPLMHETQPRLGRGLIPDNLPFTGEHTAQKGGTRISRMGGFEVYMIVDLPQRHPASAPSAPAAAGALAASSAGAAPPPAQSPPAAERVQMIAALHSKLFSRRFPRAETILKRVQALLQPIFEHGPEMSVAELDANCALVGGSMEYLYPAPAAAPSSAPARRQRVARTEMGLVCS